MVQTAGKTPLCSGLPASFEALPVNGGTNPLYQWMVNQTPVPGANGLTFTSSTLANNDELQVIMISNDPCVLSPADTSDPIVITTQPSFNPSVSIALVEGDNPGCLDSMVKLQATVNDFGSNPLITWHVNGFGSIFTGPDFESSAMQDGDVVTVRVTATDAGCYLPDTVFSNSIVMIRSLTPEPPVISLIGNMLYTDKPGSYTWFGPGGKLTGSTIGEYHPGELGTYWAKAENNGCFSPESNRIRITLLDIQKINLSSMRLFPNPTKGLVTLQWGQRLDAEVTVSSLVGQTLLQFKVEGAKEKTLDLGTLANGTYLLTVQEANGATATHRVTLNR